LYTFLLGGWKNCDDGPLFRTIPRNFSDQGGWRNFFSHRGVQGPLDRL